MSGTSRNGSRSANGENVPNTEVVGKGKRRRFSSANKLRILHKADACAPGKVGAYLRNAGIDSAQLYAWRRERDQGKLDPQTLKDRK